MPFSTKHAVTIAFDTAALESYTDSFLSQLWHVGQANPAPITDRDAGEIAEAIGREIIRRWLRDTPAALWSHQGQHAYSCILSDAGHWPGPTHERWVYGRSDETREQVAERAAVEFDQHVQAV